jgi:prolyl-tRNA editing enzyme YbaK/EbsC (Cys-tRNA(Pro) deacylase)
MTFNRFEAKINQPAAEINTRPGDDLVELRWFTAAELLDQPLVPGTIELFKTAGYLSLHFTPALDRPDLLAPSTRETIERATNPADILVAEIDPAAAATDLFNQRYHFDPAAGANCVIIQATRGDTTKYAAVLVQPGTRADLNGLVRKHLDARRVSFAPHDLTLELTGMEYGSINPIGLPADWPVLIDQRVMQAERVIIGSGLVRSKLYVRPQTIAQLTGGEVLDLVKA